MSTFGRLRFNDLQWEQFKNSVTITNCPHEEIHWTKVRAQLEEDLKTCIECNTPCFNSVWEIYQHHLTWSFPHGLPRLTEEIQEQEAFSAFANGKMLFVTMTTLVLGIGVIGSISCQCPPLAFIFGLVIAALWGLFYFNCSDEERPMIFQGILHMIFLAVLAILILWCVWWITAIILFIWITIAGGIQRLAHWLFGH